ncbi:MAG TPA: hypothetical protein VL574_08400 [Stellaceae bacterium]|jgi:hypothetical protein|nr:hypothetical protein [Stellaceae bacterium]
MATATKQATPTGLGSMMQHQFDMWTQAASVMTDTASAIWVRQAEIMKIATGNAAQGLLMLSQDNSAGNYAVNLRLGAESIIDDMREIGMLSRDCQTKLLGIYVETYRRMAPGQMGQA